MLICDDGIPGLTIRLSIPGRHSRINGAAVDYSLGAGEDWDQAVKHAVGQGWAGIECLAGIPGLAGAAPIQNIGAYGQDISQTVLKVRVFSLSRNEFRDLSALDCEFGYRQSRFKRASVPDELVTRVTLRLAHGGAPTVAYKELAQRVGQDPTLLQVLKTVQELRRQKSMLANTPDGNHRSAGSFFLNPTLTPGAAEDLLARCRTLGIKDEDVPRWPSLNGDTKFAAAWLIERSGLAKGYGDGPVGLSTNHTLAIVNRGGASAGDILRFALHVRGKVEGVFGIALEPEPRALGFDTPPFG